MSWRKRKHVVAVQGAANGAGSDPVPRTVGEALPLFDSLPEPDAAPLPASIGRLVRVQGEISGEEDVVVEGRIDGRITLPEHELRVAPTGVVHADVIVRSIQVEGEVVGNITASERVEIMDGGSVVGDISTNRLVIADGARFRGRVEMDLGPGGSRGELNDLRGWDFVLDKTSSLGDIGSESPSGVTSSLDTEQERGDPRS